jgi:hypothetical protein
LAKYKKYLKKYFSRQKVKNICALLKYGKYLKKYSSLCQNTKQYLKKYSSPCQNIKKYLSRQKVKKIFEKIFVTCQKIFEK